MSLMDLIRRVAHVFHTHAPPPPAEIRQAVADRLAATRADQVIRQERLRSATHEALNEATIARGLAQMEVLAHTKATRLRLGLPDPPDEEDA